MTTLKHLYLTKRTHVIDSLNEHQNTVEDFLKIFTDAVDAHRKEVLREEYIMSDKMNYFEMKMK